MPPLLSNLGPDLDEHMLNVGFKVDLNKFKNNPGSLDQVKNDMIAKMIGSINAQFDIAKAEQCGHNKHDSFHCK